MMWLLQLPKMQSNWRFSGTFVCVTDQGTLTYLNLWGLWADLCYTSGKRLAVVVFLPPVNLARLLMIVLRARAIDLRCVCHRIHRLVILATENDLQPHFMISNDNNLNKSWKQIVGVLNYIWQSFFYNGIITK